MNTAGRQKSCMKCSHFIRPSICMYIFVAAYLWKQFDGEAELEWTLQRWSVVAGRMDGFHNGLTTYTFCTLPSTILQLLFNCFDRPLQDLVDSSISNKFLSSCVYTSMLPFPVKQHALFGLFPTAWSHRFISSPFIQDTYKWQSRVVYWCFKAT